MSKKLVPQNRRVFDELHPRIYAIAVGLIAWFALMAWVFFDRSGYVSLALTFVTLLFIVATVLPWLLSLVWKHHTPDEQHSQPVSLHDWSAGDFEVWGAKLHGTQAAIDALLPLIAVSLGVTAIGIVFVIVRAMSV